MPLELSNVALVCCDTRDPQLSLESLEKSLGRISFGECVFVTSLRALERLPKGCSIHPKIRVEIIEPFSSINDYSRYVLRELKSVSNLPFFLVTQWDGWVLSPDAWVILPFLMGIGSRD